MPLRDICITWTLQRKIRQPNIAEMCCELIVFVDDEEYSTERIMKTGNEIVLNLQYTQTIGLQYTLNIDYVEHIAWYFFYSDELTSYDILSF